MRRQTQKTFFLYNFQNKRRETRQEERIDKDEVNENTFEDGKLEKRK